MNPAIIYLAPECIDDPEYGRRWCETCDPVDCECDDGPHPWIPYMLAEPQPMDTAPMDGTRILCWCPEYTPPYGWCVVTWTGGLMCDGWYEEFDGNIVHPICWLPLPPVPDTAQLKEKGYYDEPAGL